MKYFKSILLLSSLLLLLYACDDNSTKTDQILKEAESYINTEPEKALSILDSIPYPDELDIEKLYDYILLQVQAKDKTYKDITGDSIVFEIKKYYKEHKNEAKLAMATYYCGRILDESSLPHKAMTEYLEAEAVLDETDGNANLKGLVQSSIGLAFYRENMEGEARQRFFNARRYYMEADNIRNEIISTSQIGLTYMLSANNDSAYFYYQKALGMADQLKNNDIQVMIRQNIGVIYRGQRKYETAKKYFNEALEYSNTDISKARVYNNLAKVYQGEVKIDSALYYLSTALELIKDQPSSNVYLSTYKSFSDVYESIQDYQTALTYNKQYGIALRKFFDKDQGEAISNIQRKYNYELVRNTNNKLKIQQLTTYLIGAGIFIVMMFGILYFFRLSKKHRIQGLEKEKQISHLNTMAKGFNEKENSFRARLLYQFDIMRKSALLEGYLREDEKKIGLKLVKKFNEVVYNQETLDWDMLYNTMNELHDGFFDILREAFPELDEPEFRICCLIYTDFSNSEMSVIMRCSSNTITARRSTIRKKIGIKYYGSIIEHLDKVVLEKMKEKNITPNLPQKSQIQLGQEEANQ